MALFGTFTIRFVLESVFFANPDMPFLRARQMLSFPAGVLLAVNKYKIERTLTRAKNILILTGGTVGLLFMAITQLNAVKSLPYIVSNVMALLTCLPMAIGIMAFGKLFSELSENKMLAVTGMISYEIYLVHAFTLGMIKPSVVSVLAFVVVTVTLAYVTYFTIGKMKMANLTIIILTKNEEQNLEKCIASFKSVAQRIVIIDSYSTDKTVELAKSLGAEVYEHPFENHAVQFNWARITLT